MAIQNNVLWRQWATLNDSQNTFHYRYLVQSGKKGDGSLEAIVFVVQSHRLSHGKMRVSFQPMECKMTTLTIDGSNIDLSLMTEISSHTNA